MRYHGKFVAMTTPDKSFVIRNEHVTIVLKDDNIYKNDVENILNFHAKSNKIGFTRLMQFDFDKLSEERQYMMYAYIDSADHVFNHDNGEEINVKLH